MTMEEQLQLAMQRARGRLREGIGTQSERLVHSTLKYYLEPDESRHEIKIGHFVADIFKRDTGQIFEIQTRSFDRLRAKLTAWLPEYPVAVIHPIVQTKYLCWVHPETGEVVSRRKSPRQGRPVDILREIYRLPELQNHPNLSFMALMFNAEEYRLLDGYSRDHKKGSHRMERLPLSIEEQVWIRSAGDFAALLPVLPTEFTRKELASAARLSPQAVSYAVKVWERAGSIEKSGRRGRQYVYQRGNHV